MLTPHLDSSRTCHQPSRSRGRLNAFKTVQMFPNIFGLQQGGEREVVVTVSVCVLHVWYSPCVLLTELGCSAATVAHIWDIQSSGKHTSMDLLLTATHRLQRAKMQSCVMRYLPVCTSVPAQNCSLCEQSHEPCIGYLESINIMHSNKWAYQK